MDEQPRADEPVVEDLDVTSEEGDEVKGGGQHIKKLDIQLTSGFGAQPDAQRGGWDGNHNESLVRA